MSWEKTEKKSEEPKWQPLTPKPEKDFFCQHCNGSGFVPVCVVDKRGMAIVRDATCECQAGRYEAEHLERDSMCKGGVTLRGRRFRLADASRHELTDPDARTHKEHWLHAKLCEARHDMVRKGDGDDWMVRYLEAVKAGADPAEWTQANPRGLVRHVQDFTITKNRVAFHTPIS